jgi:uncharacterized delta-60 repeat protein
MTRAADAMLARLVVAFVLYALLDTAGAATLDPAWGNAGTAALAQSGVVTGLTPRADGRLLAVVENSDPVDARYGSAFVMRVTGAGQVDAAFAPFAFQCVAVTACGQRVAIDAQGRAWVVADIAGTPPGFAVHRLRDDGTPDPAFGTAGTITWKTGNFCTDASCPFSLVSVDSVTALADGRLLMVFYCSIAPPHVVYGSCLVAMDTEGMVQWARPVPGFFQEPPGPATAALPDGSALVAGYVPVGETGNSTLAIVRIRADGTLDPAFGTAGVAVPPIAGFPLVRQVVATPQGGAVLMLNVAGHALLLRVLANGMPDPAWGNGGFVAPPSFVGNALALLPDGGVVAAGSALAQPRLLRLRPDGRLETRFGGAGLATFDVRAPSLVDAVLVQPGGRVIAGGADVVGYQIMYGGRAGNIPVPVALHAPRLFGVQASLGTVDHPWVEIEAVEYFNAAYGNYFMTVLDDEMAILDQQLLPGWKRTGNAFRVYAQADAALAPVCRFWSDQTFAPKSSHFYTPFADECATVKASPAWTYEGIVYELRLPEGMPGSRTCPALSQPLYRLYNNGAGGAPNHRYTLDPATVEAMLAQGWIVEGEAATRVFACVPVQNDPP